MSDFAQFHAGGPWHVVDPDAPLLHRCDLVARARCGLGVVARDQRSDEPTGRVCRNCERRAPSP